MNQNEKNIVRYFYVDEAGDLTLFNKKGQIIVGREGISQFFMVGIADIKEPEIITKKLTELRNSLLSDPYYKNVPSMQLEKKKTSLLFHAKNDLPEVRREVFKLLKSFEVKVQVAIKRKFELAEFASDYQRMTGKKLTENQIYDDLIKRLFRNVLHKAEKNVIVFARRGVSNRNIALTHAIETAKRNFESVFGKKSDKQVVIQSAYSHEFAGLQVIDYYLWALQRLYERKEIRFFESIRDDFRLIMDLDDKRNNKYGEWYSDSNKLELKKIKPG